MKKAGNYREVKTLVAENISLHVAVRATSPALYVQHLDSGALLAAGYLALLAKCKYTLINVQLSAAHVRRGGVLQLKRARPH